ncbi:conserved hypothetical protein [Luminiphilus syltensis NOR5-1B]|uniref:Phytochrome sensor protein n=1 Tax=Luminiphilus syltensis NOR5-1B TaxID=565045 RepID=B8KSV2_9GAMM|nr:DUF484 family protein [Luminiphilus syltensis]EED35922.1 conserved hypothetical protein [Luminiphilus syltensis NOR5-1B]
MSRDKAAIKPSPVETDLDHAAVEAFLLDNPHFFMQHPGVLAELELPHGESSTVSLVERQVSLLRERNIEMRRRLAQINQWAKANDVLFAATRTLVLNLLEVRDVGEIKSTFDSGISNAFEAQFGALHWLPAAATLDPELNSLDTESSNLILSLVKHQQSLSGVLRAEEMTALFSEAKGEGSGVVTPLRHNDEIIGVIAVGSHDTARYQSDDGTLFIDHLAEVIVRLPVFALL